MCCKGQIILNDNNEEKSAKNTGQDVENCSFSCVHLGKLGESFDAPLSMEFSRRECRSPLPFPTPEDLPDPGIKPKSLAL